MIYSLHDRQIVVAHGNWRIRFGFDFYGRSGRHRERHSDGQWADFRVDFNTVLCGSQPVGRRGVVFPGPEFRP